MKFLLVALLAAGSLQAADSAFDAIVHQVESAYHVKPLHIPFQKTSALAGMVSTPFGLRPLQLAIFEDLPKTREPMRLADPGEGWQLVIRTESSDERVQIYARPAAARIQMLVVSDEEDEIAVVESEVSPAEFARQINKEAEGDEPLESQ
jgi:hypothetical protein